MNIIAPVALSTEGSPVTRASAGTYWDRLGVLQTAIADALRVTYDPNDLSAAPYPMIEAAATNLILYSAQFDNAAWVKTGVTVTANAAAAPDGTMTADTLSASAADSLVSQAANAAALTPYTFTLWLRATVTTSLRLYLVDQGGSSASSFVDCTVTTKWQRFTITRTLAAGATGVAAQIGGGSSFATAEAVYAWGAQIEAGGAATSYIATTSTAATRAADVLGGTFGLLYSNLTENDTDDAPLWLAASSYTKDQYVRRPNHKVYRALQAVTAGKTPEDNLTGTAPLWMEWEPTNRWAAFDTTLDTASTGPEVLQWVVRPGQVVTALAALALDAADVRVSEVTQNGELVHRTTKNLLLKTSRSITDFLFKPIERRPDEVFMDIPPFKNGLLCVTITKPGSTAKVGDIKMGRLEEIGELLVEPEIRTLRRSVIKDDGYGRYKFNKRASSKLLSCVIYIAASRVDSVKAIIDRYTAEPCVIIGDDRWTSMIILGFVEDFRVTLPDPNNASYTLQAQGLG